MHIDLGIVFQPNLYHFVFYLWHPPHNPTTPQPHTPTSIKTWPGGMPCQIRTREFASSKASAGSAHSAGQAPKIATGRPSGFKVQNKNRFYVNFFRLEICLNFGSSQNAPKSQKNDLRTCLTPILIICWTLVASIFSIFHNSQKTHILQKL